MINRDIRIMMKFCPDSRRQRFNIFLGLMLVSLVLLVLRNSVWKSHEQIVMEKIRLKQADSFRGAWKRHPKDRAHRENIFAEERAQFKAMVGSTGDQMTEKVKKSLVAFRKSKRYAQLFELAGDLITQVHNVGKERRLNYFLYGESLLGSWRHHEMILGDTTVAVFIGARTRTDFRQGLHLLPGYTIIDRGTYFVFKKNKNPNFFKRGQIDMNVRLRMEFYKENISHIWEAVGHHPIHFNKSLFFPVHERPFCGKTVLVPRDTLTVLQIIFGQNNLCPQPPIGQRNEIATSDHILKTGTKVRCNSLLEVVPFVDRYSKVVKNVTVVEEALRIDGLDVLTIEMPARGMCVIPFRDSLKCDKKGTKDHGAIV